MHRGETVALATVVSTAGSAPQIPGARLLLRADGTCVGTVGGGAVEHRVLEALRSCQKQPHSQMLEIDLARDLGMCCGGRMVVFIETLTAHERLVLFGAGHVAQPTASLARTVGFRVTVVDDREELNTAERFPECERLLMEPEEASPFLAMTERDWIVILTHDHRLDEEAARTYLKRPHRYMGLIGSQRKVIRILKRLALRGDPLDLERFYAPVGLSLGAVTPQEIAVSIVAELIALRRGQPSQHLRVLDHHPNVLGGTAHPAETTQEPGTDRP
ncbi:MAG: XdhC family protein [Myxococcales bacterium]|nr:XdhC family protein [Myxococcales bacterium]